jgi:hypothetical protein
MTGNFPWPAIDNSGQRTPRLDYELSTILILQFGRTAANAEVANNGLSANRAWPPPAKLSPGVPIGAQALWHITDDKECRMNGGRVYGARFRQGFTLEDAICFHACSLETSMRVTNVTPLGCPLPLTVTPVKSVQTLKAV